MIQQQHRQSAEAIQMCLSFLSREAEQADLKFVRVLIGMAIEELDRMLELPRKGN
jgi:hypothetical protein